MLKSTTKVTSTVILLSTTDSSSTLPTYHLFDGIISLYIFLKEYLVEESVCGVVDEEYMSIELFTSKPEVEVETPDGKILSFMYLDVHMVRWITDVVTLERG